MTARPATSSVAERLVVVAVVGGLVAYTVLALAAHRFISGLAAPIVAAGILVLQTPAARRAWPRLVAGTTRSASST